MGKDLARWECHAVTAIVMMARVSSPDMGHAGNVKKSYFRVLDGTKARNCPYIGGEKRN